MEIEKEPEPEKTIEKEQEKEQEKEKEKSDEEMEEKSRIVGYECLACNRNFDTRGWARHRESPTHIHLAIKFLKGKDTKTKTFIEKIETHKVQKKKKVTKGKRKRENKEENEGEPLKKKKKTKFKRGFALPPLPECECGEDAEQSEHRCLHCTRSMHSFCGIAIKNIDGSDVEGHGAPRQCIYCINDNLPDEQLKLIRSISRKLSKVLDSNYEELQAKFLKLDDNEANEKNWKIIDEIKTNKTTSNDNVQLLDVLDAILGNII